MDPGELGIQTATCLASFATPPLQQPQTKGRRLQPNAYKRSMLPTYQPPPARLAMQSNRDRNSSSTGSRASRETMAQAEPSQNKQSPSPYLPGRQLYLPTCGQFYLPAGPTTCFALPCGSCLTPLATVGRRIPIDTQQRISADLHLQYYTAQQHKMSHGCESTSQKVAFENMQGI